MRYLHGGRVYDKVVDVDFSVNLNPLGMPEAVKRSIVESVEEFQNYPDTECTQLRARLSLVEGVPMGSILCGNGADDIIYRLATVLKPMRAMVLAPTFSEYERSLHCEVVYYPLFESDNFTIREDV